MREHGVFGVEVATTTAAAGDGSNKAVILMGSGEHRLTLELELLYVRSSTLALLYHVLVSTSTVVGTCRY